MKKTKLSLIAMLMISAAAFAACGGCGKSPDEVVDVVDAAPPKEKVVIGRIPSGNVLDISEKLEPLIALMQKTLDVEVQVKFAADYAEFSRNMENQEYDLAFCAPFQYIRAHEKAGYEAALRPVRHGADTYVGIFITTSPSITTLEQLKGKRVAFVDPNSTSGYLFPLGLLATKGIAPTDIQSFFLRGHDNVVLNVLGKNYDAGACYKNAEVTYGKDQAASLRILGQTEEIYNEPITFSPRFRTERAELAAKIVSFMVTLQDSQEGLAAIEKFGDGLSKFVEAKDSDYNSVRMYASKLPPEIIAKSGL